MTPERYDLDAEGEAAGSLTTGDRTTAVRPTRCGSWAIIDARPSPKDGTYRIIRILPTESGARAYQLRMHGA